MMTKFLNIIKIPGIVVGSLVTLYGVFSFFHGLKDDMVDTKEMVNYNNMQIEGVSQQVYSLQDTAEEIQEMQVLQGQKLNNLTWIVRHRNEYTEEQLEELLDMMMRRSTVVAPVEEEVLEPTKRRNIPYRGEVEIIPVDTVN